MDTRSNSAATAQTDFIDLARTLSDMPDKGGLTDDIDLQRVMGTGRGQTWSDLVPEMRLVVLAEAGAGKTIEIQNLARRLRAEGKVAFFLRLEFIAEHFELAFEADLHSKFQQWLAGREEGWLLLDSVDEARLRNPRDFEIAIRQLASVLSTAKARTHIILTSRVSAWRPFTDLRLCHEHLPHPAPISTEPVGDNEFVDMEGDPIQTRKREGRQNEIAPSFRVVGLDDLNIEQVRNFARARGIEDPRHFLDTVERMDAAAFTVRPQDLEELIEFWRTKNSIGSRWEMMEASIEKRLTERDQSRADVLALPLDQAKAGARALAAATTLTGMPVIRVPDGASGSEGIPVLSVLPTWNDADAGVLLQRPIFDGAIYGTVRFHHRSVREYLTAEWFADLLARAPSRLGLERLFFRKQYGMEIITPMLRPILPWLVLMDAEIRERVMTLAPEVVFEGGDPSRLPMEDRRKILADVCMQVANGESGRSALDYAAVQRFANEDLAEDIRVLLKRYADNSEVAPFLLRMVWLGQLRAPFPEVLQLAHDRNDRGYRRLTAFRALNAIAEPDEMAALRASFLEEAGELDRRLLGELISGLPVSSREIAWLLAAIERAAPSRKHSVDELPRQISSFVERASLEALPELVDGFEGLLGRPPLIEKLYNEVSVKFEWLLASAARAVERLVEERHPASLSASSLSIIRRISGARAYQSDQLAGTKDAFAALVPAWPELNRAQFWHDVERMRAGLQKRKERLLDWWRPSNFGAPWRFEATDFDFAIEGLTSKPFVDDRLVALSLAFHLYRTNSRPRPWLRAMKKVATDPEVASRLHTFLHPPPDTETRRFRVTQRQWAQRNRERESKEEADRAQAREYLTRHVGAIRAELQEKPELAAQSRAIRYLFDRTRDQNDLSNHWSDYNWRSLTVEFGAEVAELFRDTARNFWRHSTPKLCSEGAPANETAFGTILGLAGLEIEARESSSSLDALSPGEVEIASRHAVSELNGFPSWFPSLYERHPDAVTQFLYAQIRYEIEDLPLGERGNDVLSDVSWSGQWAWDRLGPVLVNLLTQSEPKDAGALRKILAILRGSTVPDDDLLRLARAKCMETERSAHLGHWFALWIGVEPEAAIRAFKNHCKELGPEEQTDLAMRMAVSLLGNRFDEPAIARSAFLRPAPLSALFNILHQHIRRADDINRANSGVYSPGLRDHAQEARDSILDLLRDTSGKAAFLALRDILGAQSERPWLHRLIVEKAQREGDIDPFLPSEVHDLASTFERLPRNARQLGDTAHLRLLQLKERAEVTGDLTAEVLNIADEAGARRLLANEIKARAKMTYGLEPGSMNEDSHISLVGIGYTARQPVFTGLDRFLRRDEGKAWVLATGDANASRRGTLAVFRLVHSKGWRWPWTREPDLTKTVEALETRWRNIEADRTDLDDVEIVGIDLTKFPQAGHLARDPLDRFLEFLRWLWGSSLVRLGTTIAGAGLAAITGIMQVAIEWAILELFDKELHLPELASWGGWLLLAIGVAVAVLGHFQHTHGR